MNISGEHIRTLGSATAVVVALVGLTAYVVKMEGRITALESQVNLLTVAPSIASSGKNTDVIANPVAKNCADLAKSSNDLINKSAYTQSNEIQSLMDRLGCLSSENSYSNKKGEVTTTAR